jgi:hypothetical protein
MPKEHNSQPRLSLEAGNNRLLLEQILRQAERYKKT